MGDGDEMADEQLMAIRARLDEPPPPLALAERNRGTTALVVYLNRLQDDAAALLEEVDRLRARGVVGTLDEDGGDGFDGDGHT